MDVPLQISWKNVPHLERLDELVREKAAKLEEVCDSLTSCRVMIEKAHESKTSGSPWHVRIDMHAAPGHELVAKNKAGDGLASDRLPTIIRDVFSTARRELRKLAEQQHGRVKSHPDQNAAAVVDELFPDENYGFLRTIDGDTIYFHRNSVLHGQWDRLREGIGVRYVVEQGEKGPQASTVQIVEAPDKL